MDTKELSDKIFTFDKKISGNDITKMNSESVQIQDVIRGL